jgi:hypothetical protein
MKNRTTNRKQGRPEGATSDTSRGKRLVSELEKICEKSSPSAFSRSIYGDPSKESSFRQWIEGANIGNDALAKMHLAGVDVMFVLTGERSVATERAAPACQHGKLCELAPILLDNLAALFRQACEASPADSAAATECLRGILGSFAAQQSRTIEEQRDAAS